MIDDREVREMLHRRADTVRTIDVDAPSAVRRARRRLAGRGAVVVLAAAVLAAARLGGLDVLRTAPVPADAPAPVPAVLRANGEVLNFTGVPSAAPGDLVAVDPATGEERVIVEDLDFVYSARWSTDGRWIAYETPGPDGIELWVAGASQVPRRVATGATMLDWSSTAAEIAAIRLTSALHTDIGGSTLSTIDAETGGTADVGSIPERVGDEDVTSPPAWSPDLTMFVFGARGGAIYSLDARSGARSLLVRLPGEHLDSVDQIVWSPDGAHIAVRSDGDPGGVYVMNGDGSNVQVLLDELNTAGVAWSPDGTRLAYEDGDGVIWVASMVGPAPTEVGLVSASCSAVACQEDLAWSPDGSQIALRTAGSNGTVDVSATDADGRGEAEPIAEITFASWAGGSYDCVCP